jgi:hypothetical protein
VPTGNGLSMRMSVFLEALALIADVDLVVIPVAGEMKKFADASFYSYHCPRESIHTFLCYR